MLQFVTKHTYTGLRTEVEGSNYTPEEAKTIILTLLCHNRTLNKYLQKFKLTSKQQTKLIYIIEAVLSNHMAEEQLAHTNNVKDCLKKVKQYLNITKKFVEKTEMLLQQYDFEGESEREQLYSSVREMGPITRICTRIQEKVDSKCPKRGRRSNGSLPRKRNGLVSSVIENGEHSGSTGRYRKRKMSASSNSYRRTPKIARRYSQEESQDEQNEFSTNQQHRRSVSRSGLIKQRTKQRRRQKRVVHPETTDNESGRETESRMSTSEGEESASEREELAMQNCASEMEESVSMNEEMPENTVLSNEGPVETELRLTIRVRDILSDPAADNDPDVSKYKQKFLPKENSSKEDEEAYEVVDELVDEQAQSPDNELSDKDNQLDTSDQVPISSPEIQPDLDKVENNTDFEKALSEDEDHKSNHSAEACNVDDDDDTAKRNAAAGPSYGKSMIHRKGPRTPPGSPPPQPSPNLNRVTSEEYSEEELEKGAE